MLGLLAFSTLVPLLGGGDLEAEAGPVSMSTDFGAPGTPVWQTFAAPMTLPNANNAAEPTIGIAWDRTTPTPEPLMFQAYSSTYRVTFTDYPASGSDPRPPATATWQDVTSPLMSPVNLDPMLHTDFRTGRTWAGGLLAECSYFHYTDNFGQDWAPAANPCAGPDHQGVGSGPYVLPAPPVPPGRQPLVAPDGERIVVYYCGQTPVNGGMACTRSDDGGITYAPIGAADPTAACGGLHGHPRIANNGWTFVPNRSCGTPRRTGFAFTDNNGESWQIGLVPIGPGQTYPTAYPGPGFFDPSIGVPLATDRNTAGVGWAYVGQSEYKGAWIGLTTDGGSTWMDVGQGNGAPAGTKYFDVGSLAGVKRAIFADVVAGDPRRAAFAFLGSTIDADPYDLANNDCFDQAVDRHVWHYYVAVTYDAGRTWATHQVSTHPVQIGAIWPNGGGEACRNLLDFNDMDIDEFGRIHVGFADGCFSTGPLGGNQCVDASSPADTSRGSLATVIRQLTGCGLIRAYDKPGTDPDCLPPPLYPVPTAKFRVEPITPCTDRRFLFTDESVEQLPIQIVTMTWKWGDGSPDDTRPWMKGAVATHTFPEAKDYTVRLQVLDELGRTSNVYERVVKPCVDPEEPEPARPGPP
ncbi:MAG TPA: PKD domain-containing protein, partial [Candidatus Thermoplasmatota archaeon]|nr:PKD domain-containing protein [Candidatus Thermoplasmatota archaeon]